MHMCVKWGGLVKDLATYPKKSKYLVSLTHIPRDGYRMTKSQI